MGRIVVPYANFSGGDWGRAEAWSAPKNSFSAQNMYVTKTGELTVRAGLKNVTPTGVVAGVSPVGYLGEYLPDGTVAGTRVFYAQSQAGPLTHFIRFSPLDTTTRSDFGSIGNVTINDHDAASAGASYFVTSGGVTRVSPDPDGTVTGSPGGNSVALYLNRLVVATSGNTLRWSDVNATTGAPDFTSWTATNTVNVGDASSIIAIRAQRTHLSVFKAGGGIYVITGDMPVSTVRQVSRALGPGRPAAVRRSRDEALWFVPQVSNTPWRFDGTRTDELADKVVVAEPLSGASNVGVSGLATEEHGLFILTNDNALDTANSFAWLYMNGSWTQHTFPFPLQPFVAPNTMFSFADPNTALNTAGLRLLRTVSGLTFVDNGTTPKFYTLSLTERPGSESQVAATLAPERAGDASASQVVGNVTFPEWHAQGGEDVLVRSVIVDFRSFNTGGSLTNHFDVNITAFRAFNDDGSQSSATLSYDQAGALAATGGTLERRVFSFGDQGGGNGYQLSLTNVRGIAIQRISVVLESQTVRGVV